ncbi:Protein of unknown function [Alkalibacterium putridalgicola]|uniref:Uncharacterized protein n=1 Tax=Alkalibacterium putridalgicola TaxID=426703 RepID=A0A1H7W789_9LACT|nr:DUF3013 family protein [Alkalibacterium putridalgicola]GEK89981.1 hypothetical protein APU01nite_20200 [Alkalibacterium putridalgicola]SEM17361.1 Protein of unknown function [Alkalibacterium putridalgicola]
MSKDLSGYIDNELKEMLPNFKWKIVKESKKNLIELFLTFHVETDEEYQVQDMIGKNNEPGLVQFEDVICFYDPAYAHVKPQNYLASFSIDSHTGVEKGYVDAILRQLNYTTKKGKVELTEFLRDDFADSFALTWKESNLQNMIDTLKETGRYSEEKIPMNLDDEQSFLEKLKKGDANDGVERV